MASSISPRLAAVVDALPLVPGMRVFEIGCGPGAAARAVLSRIEKGHVLAIDRSNRAIAQARKASAEELASGRLEFRHIAVEDLVLRKGEALYDLAFAVRVGALDGRHPEAQRIALQQVRKVLTKKGRLFIDGGNPLQQVALGAASSDRLPLPKRRTTQ